MPKPIIGITVDSVSDPNDNRTRGKLELNWNYAQAVAEAGGVPLLIPPMADVEQVISLIDGLVIPGGDDIDPAIYGEERHPKSGLIDPARFASEKAIYEALPTAMPVLGICYGCQFMNVVRGGSLHQHIPDVPGSVQHTEGTDQTFSVVNDSLLATMTTTEIGGKSYHHQAVNRVGVNLNVVAKCTDDGIIEALEATDKPWEIGVQWHPERSLEDTKTQQLFAGFIAAASAYRATK